MNGVPCTYRISVKAITRDSDGRVLLGREHNGSWELPGGGLEYGENPKEGLAREVSEETGFAVDWISDQPVAFWTINKEVGSPTIKWFAFVAYEVNVSGEFKPNPDANDEVEELRYVSREEVRSLKLPDNSKPYFLGT
ncbi:MAG TPA: NUDIX hydrolase [Candidatus Saccharimonadales bacterium]|nr:NUDIX hydrolase [Candidatus Saccharimonadales bacterium]